MTTTAPTIKNGPVKATAPTPPRMTLAGVRKGRLEMPLRILLYGVEGVGKSTFAAAAPKPIFLGADSGTVQLEIDRLPEPQTWEDAIDGVRLLQRESHEYSTLVIDPVNWLEQVLFQKICTANNWQNISEPGFGKGPDAAVPHWREFIAECERLWSTKKMGIVFLAHSKVKLFKNPEGEDFERYQIAMDERGAGIFKQWCDVVLFAKHEAFAKRDTSTKKVRGVSTGARVLFTEWNAAYDAKNRHGLPEELPLSWRAFDEALRTGKARADEVRARIEATLREINDDSVSANAHKYMADAGDDLAKLGEIESAAAMKLNERRQAQQTTANQ